MTSPAEFFGHRPPPLRRGFALGLLACLWSALAAAGEISSTDPAPDAPIVNPLAKQSLRDLSATIGRPLFAPDRRRVAPDPAPAAPQEQPPAPPPPAPSVTLVGIVTDADGPQAVLRSGDAAKDARVRVGDDVGGWKVSEIAGRRLTLKLEDRTASFALFADKRSGAPSPAGLGGEPRSGLIEEERPAAPAAGPQAPLLAKRGREGFDAIRK